MATTKRLIADARKEYEETGTLAVDTYTALTGAGIDADIIMAQFETNREEQ